jgi:hypothetical protein
MISFTARGIVFASGLMYLLINALTHILRPWSGSSLARPGANFGTITNLEILRGFEHLWTTGVLSVKHLFTFAVAVAGFPLITFAEFLGAIRVLCP